MKKFTIFSLMTLFSLSGFAEVDHEARREAFSSCLKENNIAKPERGAPPSDTDRQLIDSCMKTKGFEAPKQAQSGFREAMQACLQENSIVKPERGTPPSDSDRKIVDACLKTKGFEAPGPREGRRGHRGPGSDRSDSENTTSAI